MALNKLIVFEKMHDPEKMLLELKKANRNDELSDYYLFHSLLGQLFGDLGKKENALKSYARAMELTNS
jgi:predicted RNA polymerase sigma factor